MAREKSLDDVKRAAYDKVVNGWSWISEFARSRNQRSRTYLDDYTRVTGAGASPGVMPVAEVLMCLVNTMEPSYRQLALPQPGPQLVENAARDLLAAYQDRKFSGWPYVHVYGEDKAGEFTDAVCYVAGSLVRLLQIGSIELEDRDAHVQLLQTCVTWLTTARIEVRQEDQNHREVHPCYGWSWSSPAIHKGGEFTSQLPPQTYFTTQVMTTLAEVLFDGYSMVSDQASKILDSLVGAKNFLLGSLKEGKRDSRAFGWIDFDQDIAKSTGATGIQSYAVLDNKLGEPVPQMTLYGLEALSYVDYYATQESYRTGTHRDLRRLGTATAGQLDDLFRFEADDRKRLARAFTFAMSLLDEDLPFTSACQIELAEPLNLNKGEGGARKTRKPTGARSSYVDGTVMYNIINTATFYIRFAEVIDENTDAIDLWKERQLVFVQKVLDLGYAQGAFTHVTPFEGEEKPPVIYATRAAVASLLSWGVAAPLRDVLPADVRQLIAKLSERAGLFDAPVQGTTRAGGEAAAALDAKVVKDLLATGYLAGVISGALKRAVSDTARWTSFFPKLQGHMPNEEELFKTNGQALISRLAVILSADKGAVAAEMEQLLAAKHLGWIHLKVMAESKDLSERVPAARINELLSRYRESLTESQASDKTDDGVVDELTRGML